MQHHNANTDVLPARQGLARQDSKVLGLASLGGALEFYDFMIFALMAPLLSQLFFPADLGGAWALVYTYAIFAIGYVMRPVGGLVMAHLGDRLGRKRMFTWSLLLMAMPTLAMGLLPMYAQVGVLAPILLLLCRVVQAVAIGGEVPAAWTYVSEQVPVNQVGLANGLLTAGLSVGILLGSVTVLALQAAFSNDAILAGLWRVPFVLGGVLGLLAVWMRKHLQETPIFMAIKQRRLLYQGLPLAEVWRSHKALLLIGMGINWFLLASVAVVLLAMPKLLQQQLGMSAVQATTWQVLGIALQAMGCITFGRLADKLGIGRTAMLGAVLMLSAATVFYFGLQALPVTALAMAYALMALCAGSGACLGKLVVRFPAPIRLSGMAATYNLSSALLGGLSLPLVAWLNLQAVWGAWLYLAALCVMFAVLGWVFQKRFEAACKPQ
ncbi:MAG: MFS transporter [Vitreoscilla sp.]|nr:MFS transporter [Vitreoscilla sp.]